MSLVEQTVAAALPLPPDDLRNRVPGQSLFTELARLQAKGEFGVDLERASVHVGPEAHSSYTGLLGEHRVAGILAQLGPDVTVLHSVPVGSKSSDIDHIVISQAGVFTINTKNHPGETVWVDGYGMMVGGAKVTHLRNAIHEAKRAERILSATSGMTVPVTAVVALVGVKQLTVTQLPTDTGVAMAVVRDRSLLPLVASRPVFSREQVQQIVDAAVRPATWGAAAPVDASVTALVDAYRAYEIGSPPPVSSNTHKHAPGVLRLRWSSLAAVVAALLGVTGFVYAAVVAATGLAG